MNKENIKNIMSDHVAHLTQYDDGMQKIVWHRPDSYAYHMEYLLTNNKIIVTGDMGSAVFRWEEKPTWDYNWNEVGLDYFASMCETASTGITSWSSTKAVATLKDAYSSYFSGMDSREYKEFIEKFSERTSGYPIKLVNKNYIRRILNEMHDAGELKSNRIYYITEQDVRALAQFTIAKEVARVSYSKTEFMDMLLTSDVFDWKFANFYEWGYCVGDVIADEVKFFLVGLCMARASLKKFIKEEQETRQQFETYIKKVLL